MAGRRLKPNSPFYPKARSFQGGSGEALYKRENTPTNTQRSFWTMSPTWRKKHTHETNAIQRDLYIKNKCWELRGRKKKKATWLPTKRLWSMRGCTMEIVAQEIREEEMETQTGWYRNLQHNRINSQLLMFVWQSGSNKTFTSSRLSEVAI